MSVVDLGEGGKIEFLGRICCSNEIFLRKFRHFYGIVVLIAFLLSFTANIEVRDEGSNPVIFRIFGRTSLVHPYFY